MPTAKKSDNDRRLLELCNRGQIMLMPSNPNATSRGKASEVQAMLEIVSPSYIMGIKASVEQRVVELPMGSSNATLATGAKIGQGLFASGLAADIQKQFPSLTPQQLQGLYLTWNAGVFSGTNSVFFLTGVRYTGSMPQAKAIADYLQSRVTQAVATNFTASPK